MGNTCYVNASIQAIRSIVNTVCPETDGDGPLLKALRRFVDTQDESSAAAFLRLVGDTLGRDLHSQSDTSEFLQDLVSLFALENGAIERAFQSTWVPESAVIRCTMCGNETSAPEEVWNGMNLCVKEYVMAVPAVQGVQNVALAEILPLLEEEHKLVLDVPQEFVCPMCSYVNLLHQDVITLNYYYLDKQQNSCDPEVDPPRSVCAQLCESFCNNGKSIFHSESKR